MVEREAVSLVGRYLFSVGIFAVGCFVVVWGVCDGG